MPLRSHAKNVIASLEARGETLSVAESITAGGLGSAITSMPGASQVFLGGVIAYSNDVKINILGIDGALIDKYSVVSEEVAIAMADAVRAKFGTTWGIASTGIAGPGDYLGMPEGRVWVAISGPVNQTIQLQLDSGREGMRTGAISSAIGTFARILS
jgi:nicotinamide-nucleotide amidase